MTVKYNDIVAFKSNPKIAIGRIAKRKREGTFWDGPITDKNPVFVVELYPGILKGHPRLYETRGNKLVKFK